MQSDSSTSTSLAPILQAERMLAKVETIADVLEFNSIIDGARQYAKSAKLGTVQLNECTSYKARNLRRMAELVDEGQAKGEIAVQGRPENLSPEKVFPTKLDELGITYGQLHMARKLATLSDADILAAIAEASDSEDEITCRDLAHFRDWQSIHESKSNEWYTPGKYIASARAVMGGIDVDPASNDDANKVVGAATYYTKDTNGLAADWPGRVWLNPPWGGLQASFTARLVEQFASGVTTQAIALVNAHATDTAWFAPFWNYTLCFTDHRINYEGGNGSGSTHGSVFVYLGAAASDFVREFDQWGYCVRRVQP